MEPPRVRALDVGGTCHGPQEGARLPLSSVTSPVLVQWGRETTPWRSPSILSMSMRQLSLNIPKAEGFRGLSRLVSL